MSHDIATLAAALGARAEGDGALRVARLRPPALCGADDLALAADPRHQAALSEGAAQAAILPEGTDWRALGLKAAILVTRPRYTLALATQALDDAPAPAPGVHATSVVEDGAALGEGVAIGPHCVVGAGARIGAGSVLAGQVWVAPGAELGPGALVHPGARIMRRVRIGARAILQPNAVIGGDGFSFVTPEKGAVEAARAMESDAAARQAKGFARIHSLGGVEIGDDVEIGAGACIDAGTIAPTSIGDGSKLDNLVQIGHNVRIGRTCLICGQVGVAGSAVIGDRVVLGGGAGVADHVSIGADSLIGARSALAQDAPEGSVLLGAPALPRREAIQIMMAWRRLPEALSRLRKLEKRG